MRLWLKRFFTGVIFVIWLLIMLFPCMAFNLATRTQLQIGNQMRIFLISEEIGEGIGVEWQRPFSTTDQQCMQTSVQYFMWTGEGEDIVYCQCTNPTTGESLPSTPTACQ